MAEVGESMGTGIEITTIVMGIERLNENMLALSEDQKIMSRELAKIGEVLIRMDHMNEKHSNLDKRVTKLEDTQTFGCPALERLVIERNALKKECEMQNSKNYNDIENLTKFVYKIAWGVSAFVAVSVGTALLSVIIK